ncbi:MAG: hypothetical protein V4467_01890 [Patescibacteria group bacterium]
MKAQKVLIVGGQGVIGKEFARQLQLLGHQTESFNSSDDRGTFQSRLMGVDAVGITINANDRGEAALSYLLEAVEAGLPVVTSEKRSSAYHFEAIRLYVGLDLVGCTATVGGGSEMLELFRRPHAPFVHMTGVVNGTLNFLFSRVQEGLDPQRALEAAQRMHLCERGKGGLVETVNGERHDVMLKLCNLFNFSGVSEECLTPDDLNYPIYSEAEILRLLRHPDRYRFVVKISQYEIQRQSLEIRGRKGRWHIWGGFVPARSVDFQLPSGADNVLVCTDHHGDEVMAFGEGAGAEPTASAMIKDFLRLTKKAQLQACS